MMTDLRQERLQKFFRNNRTVILPVDHGTAIPVPGLGKPGALIEALNPIVDGYVVNLGVARACGDLLEGKGLCLRTDVYKPAVEGQPDHGSYLTDSGEDAVEVGARAGVNRL